MEGKSVAPTNIVHDFSRLEKVTMDDGRQKDILLKIWDAAGDASVQNLAPLFLHNVSCCVLVYSINSLKSFEAISEWHEAFLREGKEAITVLVGNKSDLADQCDVPVAYASRLAEDLGCEFYMETSAHNDVNSIQALFKEILRKVVDKKLYSSTQGFSLS